MVKKLLALLCTFMAASAQTTTTTTTVNALGLDSITTGIIALVGSKVAEINKGAM